MIITDTYSFAGEKKKIVSLVPSLSELVCDLGLYDQLAGVTKFCVHPDSLKKEKVIIGGTKNINIEKIRLLQPDLIIASKEENIREQVELLALDFPVWVSDICCCQDALDAIETIGVLTATEPIAEKLINEICLEINTIDFSTTIPAAYLIWKDPYMTVGGDTFIHDMMMICGLSNVFGDKLRYPEINLKDLQRESVQLILLSSEPYPFNENHIRELQLACPDKKIMLADGEMFSWYGSRMKKMPSYFGKMRLQIANYVS